MDIWKSLKEAMNTSTDIRKELDGILNHKDGDGYRPIERGVFNNCPTAIIEEMIAMGADDTRVAELKAEMEKEVSSY